MTSTVYTAILCLNNATQLPSDLINLTASFLIDYDYNKICRMSEKQPKKKNFDKVKFGKALSQGPMLANGFQKVSKQYGLTYLIRKNEPHKVQPSNNLPQEILDRLFTAYDHYQQNEDNEKIKYLTKLLLDIEETLTTIGYYATQ